MGWNTLAVIAEIVIIEGSNGGVFIYDSSGNLVDSMAFLPNVDLQTNSNRAGITSYLGTIIAQLYQGQVNLGLTTDAAFAQLAAAAGQLSLTSGKRTPGGTTAALFMNSSDSSTGLYGLLLAGAAPAQAFLLPSGDTTGAADLAAITSLWASGYAVRLMPGKYYINAALNPPAWAVLQGSGTATNNSFVQDVPTTIVVTSTFVAGLPHSLNAAIGLIGPGSSANTYGGQVLRDFILDLSAAPANVDGILGWSQVDGAIIEDVNVFKATGHGVHCQFDGVSGLPDGWRMRGVLCNQGTNRGFSFQAADMLIDDCHAVANTDGFFWSNLTDSVMSNCRSANNSGNGYHYQGGAGIGTLSMSNCVSDSNALDGLFIDAVTSHTVLTVAGFSSKNDNTSAGTHYAVHMDSSSIAAVFAGTGIFAATPGSAGPTAGFGFTGSHNPPAVIDGAYVEAISDWISASPPSLVSWRNVEKNLGGPIFTVTDSDGPVSDSTGFSVTQAVITNLSNTYTLPANPLPGTAYRLTVFGTGLSGSPATALTLQLTPFGAAQIIIRNTDQTAGANFFWQAVADIVIATTGLGGTFNATMRFLMSDTSGHPGLAATSITTSGAINTTGTNTLTLGADWGNAGVGATITSVSSVLEQA